MVALCYYIFRLNKIVTSILLIMLRSIHMSLQLEQLQQNLRVFVKQIGLHEV